MENVKIDETELKDKTRKKTARSRNKRPVGRPKKVVKRPVGRPRKEVVETKKRGRPRKVVAPVVTVDTVLQQQLKQPNKKMIEDIKVMLPESYLKELEEDYTLRLTVQGDFVRARGEILDTCKDTLAEIEKETNNVHLLCDKELDKLAKTLEVEVNRSKKMQEEDKRLAQKEAHEKRQQALEENTKLNTEHDAELDRIAKLVDERRAKYEKEKAQEIKAYEDALAKLDAKQASAIESQEKKMAKMKNVYETTIDKINEKLKKENATYQQRVDKANKIFQEDVIKLDHERCKLEHAQQKEDKLLQQQLDDAVSKEEIKLAKDAIKTSIATYKANTKEIDEKKIAMAEVLKETLSTMRVDLIENCLVLEKEKERLTLQYENDLDLYQDMTRKENNRLAYQKEEQKQQHQHTLLTIDRQYEDDCSSLILQQREIQFEYQLDGIDKGIKYSITEEKLRKDETIANLEHKQRLKNISYDIELVNRHQTLTKEKRKLEQSFHSKLAMDQFALDNFNLLARRNNIEMLLLYKGEVRLKQLMKSRLLAMEEEWVKQLEKQKEGLDKIIKRRREGIEQEVKECLHLVNTAYFDMTENLKDYQITVEDDDEKSNHHIASQIKLAEKQHEIVRKEYLELYKTLQMQLDNLENYTKDVLEHQRHDLFTRCKESMDLMEEYITTEGVRIGEYLDINNISMIEKQAIVDEKKVQAREDFDQKVETKTKELSDISIKNAIATNNYNHENQKEKLRKEHSVKIETMMNMYDSALQKVLTGKEKARYLQQSVLHDSKFQIAESKKAVTQILDTIQESNQAVENDRIRVAQIKEEELNAKLLELDKQYEKRRKYLIRHAVVNTKIEWWKSIYDVK